MRQLTVNYIAKNKQLEGTGYFRLYILQENNITGSFGEYNIFISPFEL
jgi:hypothetical protein